MAKCLSVQSKGQLDACPMNSMFQQIRLPIFYCSKAVLEFQVRIFVYDLCLCALVLVPFPRELMGNDKAQKFNFKELIDD